jgi:hypothetical protein
MISLREVMSRELEREEDCDKEPATRDMLITIVEDSCKVRSQDDIYYGMAGDKNK